MCVRDIANRMIEKSSNVPRIIDRLELKKLVVRSTSDIDKRETVITLTEEGIAILRSATIGVDKTFANIIDVPEEEAAQLNTLLESYRRNQ